MVVCLIVRAKNISLTYIKVTYPKRSADIAVPVVAGVLGRRSVVAALGRTGSQRNGWRAW
jgi:hypothetical protein